MKKLIGILGVAVIAATMFFSANNVAGSGSDASLASLIGMNAANAEGSVCWNCALISPDVCGFIGTKIYIGYASPSYPC